MTDIVDRLRGADGMPWRTTLAIEAAEEIELLRRTVADLIATVTDQANAIDELDGQVVPPRCGDTVVGFGGVPFGCSLPAGHGGPHEDEHADGVVWTEQALESAEAS